MSAGFWVSPNGVEHALDDRGRCVTCGRTHGTPVTVRLYADQIMSEIRRDIATGLVPADVPDFAALHDHVDANMYADAVFFVEGPECDCPMNRGHARTHDEQCSTQDDEALEARSASQSHTDLLNAITAEVDRMIKAGKLADSEPESAELDRREQIAADVERREREFAARQLVHDDLIDTGYYTARYGDPDGYDRNGAYDGFGVVSDADPGL
jgi:hypothetical protein